MSTSSLDRQIANLAECAELLHGMFKQLRAAPEVSLSARATAVAAVMVLSASEVTHLLAKAHESVPAHGPN